MKHGYLSTEMNIKVRDNAQRMLRIYLFDSTDKDHPL